MGRLIVTRIFQGLAWLVVAGLVVEFYLAGPALFGVTSFQLHRTLGTFLGMEIVLLLAVAPVARPGRRLVGQTALLAALAVLQVLLPRLRTDLPPVAARHVINAALLLGLAGLVARAAAHATAESRKPIASAAVGLNAQVAAE